MKLTKEQRKAVKRVYDRGPIYKLIGRNEVKISAEPFSYLAFRRVVQPSSDCVMVYWKGMWLGIEPDGYTHS